MQAASGINNELEEVDETRECAFKDGELMQDENVAQEVATGGTDFNDQELCTENNTAFHPVMIGDIMDLEKDVALLQTELHKMKRSTQALVVSQPKVSYLYVRVRNEDESLLGKSRLEAHRSARCCITLV